jgi:hypothetical protein
MLCLRTQKSYWAVYTSEYQWMVLQFMTHCLYVEWFVGSVCGVAVCSVSVVFYGKECPYAKSCWRSPFAFISVLFIILKCHTWSVSIYFSKVMDRPSKRNCLPVFASAVRALGLELIYLLLQCWNFVYYLLLKIFEYGKQLCHLTMFI